MDTSTHADTQTHRIYSCKKKEENRKKRKRETSLA